MVTFFEPTVCHHVDEMASPDTTTKQGSLGTIKRYEEIWVFCGPVFDSFAAHLRPGGVGKQSAIQLKALNAQRWKLRELLHIPVEFADELCLGASLLERGGAASDGSWVLGECDFHTWKLADLDMYKPPE